MKHILALRYKDLDTCVTLIHEALDPETGQKFLCETFLFYRQKRPRTLGPIEALTILTGLTEQEIREIALRDGRVQEDGETIRVELSEVDSKDSSSMKRLDILLRRAALLQELWDALDEAVERWMHFRALVYDMQLAEAEKKKRIIPFPNNS